MCTYDISYMVSCNVPSPVIPCHRPTIQLESRPKCLSELMNMNLMIFDHLEFFRHETMLAGHV